MILLITASGSVLRRAAAAVQLDLVEIADSEAELNTKAGVITTTTPVSWGPDAEAEAKWVKAGAEKWDLLDKKDIDFKLAQLVTNDGDFFQQYFTPVGGFKTPVGEQAACLVDKASHLLNLHFCHDKLARSFEKSFQQDCDNMFVADVLKDIHECCLGVSHVPLWTQMRLCRKKTHPIARAVKERLGHVDTCLSSLKGTYAYTYGLHDSAWRKYAWLQKLHFNQMLCKKADHELATVVPRVANALFKIATELYLRGHTLDLTAGARQFMAACEPARRPTTTPAPLVAARCRAKLAKLAKKQKTAPSSAKKFMAECERQAVTTPPPYASSHEKGPLTAACRAKLVFMWEKTTRQKVVDDDWAAKR